MNESETDQIVFPKYFLSETILTTKNGGRSTHFAKFLISPFQWCLTHSALKQDQESWSWFSGAHKFVLLWKSFQLQRLFDPLWYFGFHGCNAFSGWVEPDDSLALITFDAHMPLLKYRISHKTSHKINEMKSYVNF